MKTLFSLLILLLFTIQSCTSDSITSLNNEDMGQISIALDKGNAPVDVSQVIATLSRTNYSNIQMSLNLKDSSSASITFNNIIVGLWNIKVEALNNDGIVLYSGETSVNVLPGEIIPVQLKLNPSTGGILLTISWSEYNPAQSFLIGHFPLDKNTNDYTFFLNNGELFGGIFSDGKIDGALELNGESDYAVIPHQDQYNINEKTIMFWFYKNTDYIKETIGLNDVEGLVCKAWSTGYDRDYTLAIQNQKPPFDLDFTAKHSSGNLMQVIAQKVIMPYQWYHVTCVIGSQSLKLYLNGDLVGLNTFEGTMISNDSPIILGKATVNSLPERFFSGKIDDLRIYAKALDEIEINTIISLGRN